MKLDVFINFEGKCREAVTFYAKVFNQPVPEMMTFGDAPSMDGYTPDEADIDKVMYTSLNIMGCNAMFSDVTTAMGLTVGNNIALTVSHEDIDEIKRIFSALNVNATVIMELQETFWSQCYGYLIDQFGVPWQVSHDDGRTF